MATVPVPVVQAQRSSVSTGAGVAAQVGSLPATNLHTLVNNDKTVLHVTVTATTNLTFSIPANALTDGATATKVVGPLAAGTYVIGPFNSGIYSTTVTFVSDAAAATLRAISL